MLNTTSNRYAGKISILFLSILFFCISVNGQTLEVLSSPDIKETIRDMKFIDNQTGWLACNSGMIYKTTDGGQNWFEQVTGVTKDLVKISFVNSNTGWAAALDGSIIKTIDGGSSWTEYNYAQSVPGMIFSICDMLKFFDENTGFIIAGKLRQIYLLKTIDGGISWSVKDSLVHASLLRRWYDIDFSGNSGVLVGDKKEIQKYSTDFGETWTFSTAINDNFFRDLKYVKYLSATEIVAIGEGNEFSGVPVPVYKSTDAGINWIKKNQSLNIIYDRVKGAYFKNSLEGIGVGSDGFSKAFLVRTTDGGETWTPSVLDFAFGLQSISGIGDFVFVMGTSSHLIFSTDFGNTWSFVPNKIPTSIIAISFNKGRGYAVTRNGDVYLSSDGTGNSWEYFSNAGKNSSGSLVFQADGKGFILKENSHIVKTTDFAQSWQTVLEPVSPSSRNLVGGLDFGDSDNGYAWFSLNDYGEYYVYKTTDGGDNWQQIRKVGGPGYISGNLVAFDAANVVTLGPDLWAQRTTDGGVNWEPASLNNFPAGFNTKDFEDVAKIDENRAVAIGEKFICITSDKGANWNYIEHGLNDIDSNFYKIAFSSDTLGYVALYNGVVIKTADLGASWTKDETLFDQYYLFSAAINENGKAFFGTSTGYIIGEKTVVAVREKIITNSFSLDQNYPNPFNPSTNIRFQIPEGGIVSLKIYDLLGNEAAVVVNKELPAGEYKYQWNSSGMASGVYYYRLSAVSSTGNYSAAKKMLLIK